MVVDLVEPNNKIYQFSLSFLSSGDRVQRSVLIDVAHNGEGKVVVYARPINDDLELGQDENDEPRGGVGVAGGGEGEVETPVVDLVDAGGLQLLWQVAVPE